MTTKSIQIRLESGLDARPVALLVQEASKYDSTIYITSGDRRVNAKSIMGMMSIGFTNGEELSIEAEGDDAEAAVEAMAKYIESK